MDFDKCWKSSFRRRRWWLMHIESPCKSIDCLKTSQFTKKPERCFENLHMLLVLSILDLLCAVFSPDAGQPNICHMLNPYCLLHDRHAKSRLFQTCQMLILKPHSSWRLLLFTDCLQPSARFRNNLDIFPNVTTISLVLLAYQSLSKSFFHM